MDVDSLRPGEDWVDAVEGAVTGCDVLLAVIGPDWVTASDSSGGRRLHKELDRVRLEIEAALRNGKPVIPVLVEDASMPTADDLPESLQPLLRRHAIRISHPTFESDLGALVRALRIIDRARHPHSATPRRSEDASAESKTTATGAISGTAAAAGAAAVSAASPAAARPAMAAPPAQAPTPAPGPARDASPAQAPAYVPPPPPVPLVAPAQSFDYTQPAYPYAAPLPTRPSTTKSGTSPVLIGLLAAGFIVVIGFFLLAVLRVGPFAATADVSPTPAVTAAAVTTAATQTASPTLVPESPSPGPTVTPIPPTATVGPPTASAAGQTAFPAAAFTPIWAVVPDGLRATCSEDSTYDTPRLYCFSADEQISLWYEKSADIDALNSEYDGWLTYHAIDREVANCFDGDLPCEGPYKVGGFDPAGRVAGVVDSDSAWIYWTHEPALVFGEGLITLDSGRKFSDLFDYWINPGAKLTLTAPPSP